MTTQAPSNVNEPEIVISVEQPDLVNIDNSNSIIEDIKRKRDNLIKKRDSLIKKSIRLRKIGIIFMIISGICYLIWMLILILKPYVNSS